MSDWCALRVKGLGLGSRAHMLQVEWWERYEPVLMPSASARLLIATIFVLALVRCWRQVFALVVSLLDNAQVIVMVIYAIRLSIIFILY